MTADEIARLPTPRTDDAVCGGVNASHWMEDRDALIATSKYIEQKLAAAVMALELALKWTHVHSEEAEADEKRIIETIAAIKEMG